MQALILSDSLLKTKYKKGLIVCAEKYSKYMSKNDIKTRFLFSDAASATQVLRSNQENILGIDHGYNGCDSDSLKVDDLTGKNLLTMDGSKVFLFGISTLTFKALMIFPSSKTLILEELMFISSANALF